MKNLSFDEAIDRIFVVYESETKGVMVTQLADCDTGSRYSIETSGTTTKLRKWTPRNGRAHIVATYKSQSREAARKKHFGVVGFVQREGV